MLSQGNRQGRDPWLPVSVDRSFRFLYASYTPVGCVRRQISFVHGDPGAEAHQHRGLASRPARAARRRHLRLLRDYQTTMQ